MFWRRVFVWKILSLSAASNRPCRPKPEVEGEGNSRRHGGLRRRLLRKVHIGLHEATSEVRDIEFTDSRKGDAPVFPERWNGYRRQSRDQMDHRISRTEPYAARLRATDRRASNSGRRARLVHSASHPPKERRGISPERKSHCGLTQISQKSALCVSANSYSGGGSSEKWRFAKWCLGQPISRLFVSGNTP